DFPTSQRELLVAARRGQSQAAFAKALGVDRSCLSRYENEKLGAPTQVLNFCLAQVAGQINSGEGSALQEALSLMKRATEAVERASRDELTNPTQSLKPKRRAG
ncbi:helix-turn-helix domain-containing protein, partial [Xanthomonas vesicatoria]|uniref:helix-turn-helix domain-containing protein n=2 Tax=Xanthomonas TaxID=338 RepID=UPI00241273BA